MNPLAAKKGLSIERLHVLCRVAEHGGIAAAAPDSLSEQSKISSQLKQLSGYFGVELTKRRGKGIVITPAGEELARLCREHFVALEDFYGRCVNKPPVIAIGAGDSLLQWIVLPRLEKIQAALGLSRIEVSNLRTADIVDGITNLSLDFGLIRKNAVPKSFKSSVVGTYSYSIWIPQALAPSSDASQLKRILEAVPFAMIKTHWGMVFDDLASNSEKIKIRVSVLCDSFPQVLQVLTTGKYAVVMPSFAKPFISAKNLVEIRPKFLANVAHEVCLAWNPRFTHVKSCGEKAVEILTENLKFPSS